MKFLISFLTLIYLTYIEFRSSLEYRGDWSSGSRHGFGTLNKDGCPKYIGSWVNGKMQGYGMKVYANGVYEGDFCQGKRHGFGRMHFKDGRRYKGFWEDDVHHGYGILKTGEIMF